MLFGYMITDQIIIEWLEIAKTAFFILYIISTIGVLVGVYWEKEEFPQEKKDRGWRLLVRSLAFDTLFTILIFVCDAGISTIQRNQIIALETKLAPRIISEERINVMSTGLQTFSGQEYVLSVAPGSEPMALACSIDKMLVAAHWKRIPSDGPIKVRTDCGELDVNAISGLSIRTTVTPTPQTKLAAVSLLLGLSTKDMVQTRMERDPADVKTPSSILIMVGSKF